MTITANEVIYDLGRFLGRTDEDEFRLLREDARILLAHIDAQAARIAELQTERDEFRRRFSLERQILEDADRDLQSLREELAALRDEVSTWEAMRRANKLPETIGATILYAASLKLERAEQKPVGKFCFEPLGQRWHHIKQGEQQTTEPKLPMKKLYAEPVPPAPVAVPDVLGEKFIDWVCLTCVDVRNAAGDFEAQDSINDIRQALEEKAEVLRLNSGSVKDA